MESDKRVDIDEERVNKIRRALTRILTADDEKVATVTRAVTRQARMFTTPTRVNFSPGRSDNQTVFELITADRPGLLSQVGQVFIERGINISSAKIMTIGERAEDVFYISELSGKPLTASALDDLADSLRNKLKQNDI
jgi:[protein-PII] uridylyltransferase